MNLSKEQKCFPCACASLRPNEIDFTKKHKCYRSEDRWNEDRNPLIIHFDSINDFSHFVKKDENNLYCKDNCAVAYEQVTVINIKGETYTVYNIHDFEIKDNLVLTNLFEDSEDDIYLYARDKRDVTIYKVFKSIDKKEIYIIPFGGYSMEDDKIINKLINMEILKHKYTDSVI